jgi:hypothetical protein
LARKEAGVRHSVKVVPFVVALTTALALPAGAGAYGGTYCGSLKGSGNWCGWPSGAHTWEYNSAAYLGSGVIPVCQRLWDQINNNPYGNTCGNNFTERFYYPNRTWGAHVAQFSGYNHTVWGYATTNRCDVIVCGTPAARRKGRGRASSLQDAAAPIAEPYAEMVTAPPAETARAFGVFNRPAGARDVPLVGPSGVPLRGRSSRWFGANFRVGRRAQLASRYGVFLIPGRGYVCASLVVGVEAATSCVSLDNAVGGRLLASVATEAGDTVVFGAVPDGVDEVSLRTAAGSVLPAAVHDNAFVVALDGEPAEVAFATNEAQIEVNVPYSSNE